VTQIRGESKNGYNNYVYMRPLASNFPVVDSLLKIEIKGKPALVGFQMTIADEHPSGDKKKEFQNLVKALGYDSVHLIWIPKPDNSSFDAFESQTLDLPDIKVYQYKLHLNNLG
jgi:hypothetical protein